jgi:hypothetical protein
VRAKSLCASLPDVHQRPTRRALAGAIALCGVLIAAGSQWNLVRNSVSGPAGALYPHLHTITPQFSAAKLPLDMSFWTPLVLLVCGIILASLGFDVGSEMPSRVSFGWAAFLVACVATTCATNVGLSVIHTATSLGPGFVLVAVGSVFGLAGSAMWSQSLPSKAPRQHLHGRRVAS